MNVRACAHLLRTDGRCRCALGNLGRDGEYQILLLRIGCRYNAAVSGGNLLIVIIDLHIGDLRIDIAVAVYQRLAYLAVALHLVYQERRCTAYADGHRQGDLRRRNLLDLLGKQLVADTGYDSDRSDQHQQIDNIDDAEQLALFVNASS